MTEPAYGPNFPWAKPTPEPTPDPLAIRPPTSLSKLRIGDRIRSLVDDVNVSVGLEGLIVNVAPPRYLKLGELTDKGLAEVLGVSDEAMDEVARKHTLHAVTRTFWPDCHHCTNPLAGGAA